MGYKRYEVPVVYADLEPTESLLQSLDALAHLNKVAANAFDKILSKVNNGQQRINSLSNRLATCQSKIQQLTGSAKATTIYSTPKYPGPESLNNYVPSHTNIPDDLCRPHHTDLYEFQERPKKELGQWRIEVDRESIAPKNFKTSEPIPIDEEAAEGLGQLPAHLPSITDFLLFNSQENPYKKYVSLDNLMGLKKKDREREVNGGKRLGDAPATILDREEMQYEGLQSVNYKPKLTNVPTIDVPQNLNLPNVASDLSWAARDDEKKFVSEIAPSYMPDLPSVSATGADPLAPTEIIADLPPTPAQTTSSGPPPPPPPGGAPPPPPPPGMDFSGGGAPPPPPPPPGMDFSGGSAPPPPPPPPMADLPSLTLETPQDDDEPTFASSPAGGDSRGDLLEAIRNAGGGKMKLKSAKDRKLEQKSKKDPPAAAPDLFGSLITALKMRRKGISDKRDKEGDGEESAAPQRTRATSDAPSGDDQWEDD